MSEDMSECSKSVERRLGIQKQTNQNLVKILNNIIHDQVVVMQSAWIEWRSGKGADAAMQWIENELEGPGHIPEEGTPFCDLPQAWFDEHKSDPFPRCWCGMPSNILQNGKGFCCDEHHAQGDSIFKIPGKVM